MLHLTEEIENTFSMFLSRKWKHECRFGRTTNSHECSITQPRNTENMFSIFFRKFRDAKKENNFFNLIIKFLILFACAFTIRRSTARVLWSLSSRTIQYVYFLWRFIFFFKVYSFLLTISLRMCLEHQSGVLEMSYDFAFSDSSFDSTIVISTVLFLTGKLTGTFKTRNDEMTHGEKID